MSDTHDDEKNKGGRPVKFETVEELERAIRGYFDTCDPHTERRVVDCGINEKGETIWREREVMTEQRPYTVSGLARAIGLTRQGLIEYGRKEKFSDTVEAAKERCHEYAESQLYGRAATGAAFSLKNNWNWRDKTEVDHTTQGDKLPGAGYSELNADELRKLAKAADASDTA